MQQFSIFRGIRGFVSMYNRVLRFRSMHKPLEVERRAKILTFYETHGFAPTKDAFFVSRPTLFRWRQKLKQSRGKLTSLDPKTTKPRQVRMRHTEPWVIDFIITERRKQTLGKAKLHVLLRQKGYLGSCMTVDRILSDLKHRGLIKDPVEYSLYAKTGRLHIKRRSKLAKLRKPKGLPCVQIDTVVRYVQGIKRYTITAIDTETRRTHAKAYTSHASLSASEFLRECTIIFSTMTAIQTDNGSEFAKHFRNAAKELSLTHYHIYPRCPDMNAYVERFNRTLDEEFLRYHTTLLRDDVPKLNLKLAMYLHWYNYTRPHHGLGLLSPMQYISSIIQKVS